MRQNNNRPKMSRRSATALLSLAPALLMCARPARAADPPKDPPAFRIGALLGLTDKANWNALVMQRGITMAVDEINAKGGIDGIKVEAAIEDHQGVPRVGVDALERLRARYDIQAVLLSYSTVGLATAPICEQHKILMLDGGAVTDSLVGKFSYLFHNRSTAGVLARAALIIPKGQKFKKMAELAYSTDDGQSLVRAAEADWKAYGGEVVGYDTTLSTASNIDTQIAKLRTSGADFLALWEFSPGPGLALMRAREFGMQQPIIGVEFTAEIQKIAGPHSDGYQFASDYFNPNADAEWPKRFATATRRNTTTPRKFTPRTTTRASTSLRKRSAVRVPAAATISTASAWPPRCAPTRKCRASTAATSCSNPTARASSASASSP
jgi:branched-chain amino acid transport system substrate-binding protein